MQAAPENRPASDRDGGSLPLQSLLIAAVILVAAVILYVLLRGEPELQPEPLAEAPAEPPAPRLELPPAPDIPRREPSPAPELATGPAEPPSEPAIPPVPALADSDEAAREALSGVTASPLVLDAVQTDSVVQRGTGVIDALSRGVVMRKILPLTPPAGKFSVVEEAGVTVISPASYARYDDWAEAIAGLDSQAVATAFHRFRSLFEEAYVELGLPAEKFDNAVIGVLDQIIATPVPKGPVAVEQPSVMYRFADPALESATPLQKQLLRMGPANMDKVQVQAKALRAALLGTAPVEPDEGM